MDPWNPERARNWHLFMPPARPSPAEVLLYESIARSSALTQARDWMLLGSTPEIRSLAARMGRRLVIVDINDGVFYALRSMVEPLAPETFIQSDWVDVQIACPVDIVFADGALNMLPPERHDALLRKIHDLLRPGGHVLIRVHLAVAPRFSTPEQVFEWFRKRRTDEPVFSATRTHLDMLWLDKSTRTIDFAEYHQKIAALYREQRITDEEFVGYDRLLRFNKIKLSYTTREVFERLIDPLFDILSVGQGGDYSCHEQHPVFHLKKKTA